ncbi:MAG: NADH:ubiquinone oxidoreductase subunit, partial [Mycobacterium sp.]|nr:NADH:ubiquinone oxidoreductase subunit [Mycobacterium sp.]
MTGMPWLTVLWAVPMVGAGVVILLPSAARHLAKYAALALSLVVLAIAVLLAVTFDPAGAQYQFVEDHAWIPSFGTGYILGLDGIALALVVLTAVLVPLLIVAGWNDGGDQGRSAHAYMALTLAVEGMVLISLTALDVLLFYVFFEAMLIPMYFLIGGFGGSRTGETTQDASANRSKAAVKF